MIAAWRSVVGRVDAAAAGRKVEVLAVSKTRPAQQIRALAEAGQRSFGENYVQEARGKQTGLSDCSIEWHLIGPLQSNKCSVVAGHFDWLQTLDRTKLVPLLARHRPEAMPPLNVLIQVNIDDESSKAGCTPDQMAGLAEAVAREPRLRLRGLMAIPAPAPELNVRRRAFENMRILFQALVRQHPGVDTLSMGMSDDFELAIAEGATMVRVGSLLFGPRSRE